MVFYLIFHVLVTILGVGNSVMIKTALVPKYLGVKTIYSTAKGIFEEMYKNKIQCDYKRYNKLTDMLGCLII